MEEETYELTNEDLFVYGCLLDGDKQAMFALIKTIMSGKKVFYTESRYLLSHRDTIEKNIKGEFRIIHTFAREVKPNAIPTTKNVREGSGRALSRKDRTDRSRKK